MLFRLPTAILYWAWPSKIFRGRIALRNGVRGWVCGKVRLVEQWAS